MFATLPSRFMMLCSFRIGWKSVLKELGILILTRSILWKTDVIADFIHSQMELISMKRLFVIHF